MCTTSAVVIGRSLGPMSLLLALSLAAVVRAAGPDFDCRVLELGRLVKPHGMTGDQFGYALAVGPELALLGTPQDDSAGPNAGAVYVYRCVGPNWVLDGTLTPSAPWSSGLFGAAVGFWADNAVIGAPGAGQVYFLWRSTGGWIEEARFTLGGEFGQAVGIYGEVAVIGDPRATVQGLRSGAAYVYRRQSGRWQHETVLRPADPHADQSFGAAVAVWQNVVLVGASLDDALGQAAGAAYIFRWDGSSWRQEAKLTGWDLSCCAFFGEAVALHNDLAVCGARRATGLLPLTGAAYVFRYDGQSWTPYCKLAAGDGGAFDDFGCSVALFGRTVVVGARRNREGGVRAGAAYVYRLLNQQYTEAPKLVPSDGRDGDYFGSALALCGGSALVGAYQADPSGSNSGAVYAYRGLADCNVNSLLDACDIVLGASPDLDADGVPDECQTPGDLNCDGLTGVQDVAAFVLALAVPARYMERFADCNRLNGDINRDGVLDFDDINAFVALLTRRGDQEASSRCAQTSRLSGVNGCVDYE